VDEVVKVAILLLLVKQEVMPNMAVVVEVQRIITIIYPLLGMGAVPFTVLAVGERGKTEVQMVVVEMAVLGEVM
jgi:hypothetical protein